MKTMFMFLALAGFVGSSCASSLADCFAANGENHPDTIAICEEVAVTHADSLDTVSKVLITQASYQIKKSEFNHANDILDKALNTNPKFLENGRFRYNWLRKKGTLYFAQESYVDALPYFEQAVEVAKIMGESELIAISSNDVGTMYSVTHKYQQALEWLKQSLDIQTELENYDGAALSLSNIAEIYLSLEEYAKALSYFDQSLLLHKKSMTLSGNSQEAYDLNVAKVYISKSQVHAALKHEKAALASVQQALIIFQKYQLIGQQVQVLSTKGRLLLDWGHVDEAVLALNEAVELEFKLESQDNLSLKVNRVQLFIELEQWSDAEKSANEALFVAENKKNKEAIIELLELLTSIYQKQEKYMAALEILQRLQVEKEAYFASKYDESRGVLLAEIELSQKQKAMIELEKQQDISELKSSRDRLIFLVVSLILAGLIFYLLYLLRRYKKRQSTLEEEQVSHKKKLTQLSVSDEMLRGLFKGVESELVCFDVTGQIHFVSVKNMSVGSSGKMQKQFQEVWYRFLPFIEAGEHLQKDLVIKLNGQEQSVWIHQMHYLDDLLVCLFLGDADDNAVVLADAEKIKKFADFNLQFNRFVNHAIPTSILDAGLLSPLVSALKVVNKSQDATVENGLTQDEFKCELVSLMYSCVEIWHKSTGKSNLELAEESGLWLVSVEDGHLRTRTMDRYVDIHKVPDNPRWRQVVKTGHYILSHCQLMVADRMLLNEKVEEVMAHVRHQATTKN